MKRLIAFFMLMGVMSTSAFAMGEHANLEDCTDSVQVSRGSEEPVERPVRTETTEEEGSEATGK